jgi:hypothetical protein
MCDQSAAGAAENPKLQNAKHQKILCPENSNAVERMEFLMAAGQLLMQ